MYLACIQLRNTIPVVVGYVRLLACMCRYALHHAVQQLLRCMDRNYTDVILSPGDNIINHSNEFDHTYCKYAMRYATCLLLMRCSAIYLVMRVVRVLYK